MNSKGQIKILFGIVIVLLIVGVVLGFRFLKKGEEPSGEEETVESPGDKIPPVRSNLLPSGVLAAGTTETQISCTIDEPGYCRYSDEPGKSYDSMNRRFSYSKDKTFHKAKIEKLKNGQTYRFYVRCRDLPGNKNTDDALIEFSVGGLAAGSGVYTPSSGPDQIPPLLSNLYPTGTLPAGTTQTKISVATNEPGYCRYSDKPGQSYDSMKGRFSYDKEKFLHTATVKGLTDNRIYEYYVRCRDIKGNKNDEDAVIRFGVGGVGPSLIPSGPDSIPPSRFNPSPAEDLPASTRKTTMSLETNERAVCRYSATPGMSYDAMSGVFSSTDSTFHSTELTWLSEGGSYKYYIKCADQYGNKNTNDFEISFKVELPEDNTPPVMRNPSHTGDVLAWGTTEVVISISTNEPAYCRYSTEPGTLYKSMKNKFSHYDQTKLFHVATIKKLEDGKAYDFFVRCQDFAGNANTGDVMISFSVGRAP